ncbi:MULTISPECIES: condensation domain-containing protein [Actinosynnema]|uniref:non-ribosomal peptide synthetase n=1 Tax=Actinosynnema TaxID=40566 RepID=UPI0020A5B0B0|nr:condensation domain-containing protein [Actinosynnema pretiosum]
MSSSPQPAETAPLAFRLSFRRVNPQVARMNVRSEFGTAGSQPVLLPLSPAQKRLWFLHELTGTGPEYHIVEAFRVRGTLDRSALTRALTALVVRHEGLRTAFRSVDGEPRQVVVAPAPVEIPVSDLRPPGAGQARSVAEEALEEWERTFDLAAGRLLRARLLRLGPADHVLVLTVHHIASDGWSQGILRHELGSLYGAFAAGDPDPLPRSPVRYEDFLLREGTRADDGDLAYWRDQLAGLPEPSTLPADREPRAAAHRAVPVIRSVVDPALTARLREAGRSRGATLHMTLLAAFAALQWRHSGERDLAIGTPVAHRSEAGLERLVGLLVDTLVLRVRMTPQDSFTDLLTHVRQTALDAYRHQDTPFERIVEDLAPRRRVDRTPLFQTTFSLQPVAAEPLRLAGLEVGQVDLEDIVSRFHLELHALEKPDELTLVWVYDGDVFDHRTVDRLARQYLRLLERIGNDPGLAVEDLFSVDEEEREWLATRRGPDRRPPDAAVPELFSAQAERTPDAVAVRHGGTRLTYRDLDRRSAGVARHLAAAGVGTGDRVGVAVEAGVELTCAVLGVLRLGAVVVPLLPGGPAGGTTRAVVTDVPTTAPDDAGLPPVALAGAAYSVPVPSAKGAVDEVAGSHTALAHRVTWLAELVGLRPGDRVLPTPFGSASSIVELLAPLVAGATLVPPHGADPLDVIGREGATVAFLDPDAVERLADSSVRHDLRSLRSVVTGGQVLKPEVCRNAAAALPSLALWHAYGASETTSTCAYYDCANLGPDRKRVPIGRPVDGVVLRVLDERMNLVPRGAVGELHVGGAGLADGYTDRDTESARPRFAPDPFQPGGVLWRTGDAVRWNADGELEFIGRLDRMLKVGGRRVEPAQVESLLLDTGGVQNVEVAATANGLVARVEGDLPHPEALRSLLSTIPVPVEVVRSVDSTPREPIPRPPATEQEELLCGLFADVLDRTHVQGEDNFFALGGHSLLALRLIARVYEATGIELSVRDVFEAPTPAELAAFLT